MFLEEVSYSREIISVNVVRMNYHISPFPQATDNQRNIVTADISFGAKTYATEMGLDFIPPS